MCEHCGSGLKCRIADRGPIPRLCPQQGRQGVGTICVYGDMSSEGRVWGENSGMEA